MIREECHLSTTKQIHSQTSSEWHRVSYSFLANQSGSPMIIVVVILAVIAIGVTFTARNSTRDLTVAGMDSLHKLTINEADGATELASELLEQNLSCADGFSDGAVTNLATKQKIKVTEKRFWQNNMNSAVTPELGDPDALDFYFPADTNDNPQIPYTAVSLGGRTSFARGGAIQMSAGYEGKGKGSASGGGLMKFELMVLRKNVKDSEATCKMEWMHVIGSEYSSCPEYTN